MVVISIVAIRGCTHCDRFEENLATNERGVKVVSEFSAFSLIGTDLSDEVYLVTPKGHKELIFSFGPNPGILVPSEMTKPLAARWLTTGRLEISIGSVAGIEVERQLVDGIAITYKVGMVIPRAIAPT
jgi:hypothetical protein